MLVLSIHHVRLPYLQTQAAAIQHFYKHLIGLPQVPFLAQSCLRFLAGSQRLDLVPQAEEPKADAKRHVALEVLGLPALRHRLLSAGLSLDETRVLPGYRRFFVNDPAGNLLEILEPEPDGVWTV
jgi:catechol 2,3-dioxygenase-like lactoylglutathione lyase family enzyme